jgi:hypothetical protein
MSCETTLESPGRQAGTSLPSTGARIRLKQCGGPSDGSYGGGAIGHASRSGVKSVSGIRGPRRRRDGRRSIRAGSSREAPDDRVSRRNVLGAGRARRRAPGRAVGGGRCQGRAARRQATERAAGAGLCRARSPARRQATERAAEPGSQADSRPPTWSPRPRAPSGARIDRRATPSRDLGRGTDVSVAGTVAWRRPRLHGAGGPPPPVLQGGTIPECRASLYSEPMLAPDPLRRPTRRYGR